MRPAAYREKILHVEEEKVEVMREILCVLKENYSLLETTYNGIGIAIKKLDTKSDFVIYEYAGFYTNAKLTCLVECIY